MAASCALLGAGAHGQEPAGTPKEDGLLNRLLEGV